MKNIAIFASGKGSNAKVIIDFFNASSSQIARVSLVVCNKADAAVMQVADEAGVEKVHLNKAVFDSKTDLLKLLANKKIDYIVLAGFLWLLPKFLIQAFPQKIVNLHPSLLPKFGGKGMYGMHVHQAVKQAGESYSGITIHLVDEHYDEGKILFQEKCFLQPNFSEQEIALAVQNLEHQYFAEVIFNYIQQDCLTN
jgi:phosphoribosylglycinamide formyltransferase-1